MKLQARLLVLSLMMAGHTEMVRAGPTSQNVCIDAGPTCTEWIGIPGQSKRLIIYRSHSLEKPNPSVTRAFILVHGILRDADSHFRTAIAGAFLAGRLDDTIVIAPRFASNSGVSGNGAIGCHDSLALNEANWICDPQRPDSWRSGGSEVEDAQVTSFDFLDSVIGKLADRRLFPNIKAIVVAGHSAGGQFVMRYAMASTKSAPPEISLSYIVANPSSYAYLDDVRPTPHIYSPPTGDSASTLPTQPPKAETEFGPFADVRNCTTYNDWPYGLQHRIGYAARLEAAQLVQQFTQRQVTYLLGDADVLPSGVFDTSCPAMAQGTSRLARGVAFARYLHDRFGAHHDMVLVPYCSHSVRCMFTADVSAPVMFPK